VQSNPWQQFAETHNKGDRVEGKIKSITDFGIFIGLDGGIDGLVHLSDISWNVAGEEAVREYKKATKSQQLFCRLTQSVSVSLWALNSSEDPFNNYVALNKKGAIVTGKSLQLTRKAQP
jgi:small subunit ribosomal protein S1